MTENDLSLVIDSAVAYYENYGLNSKKVMLFSGHQLYESKFLNKTDYRIDFKVKLIHKELNETLEPPIDIAYNDISDSGVDLCLINVSDILDLKCLVRAIVL